ncbi:hypothetical protein ACOSQ2_006681 [Xanthoceras sorbifolium]
MEFLHRMRTKWKVASSPDIKTTWKSSTRYQFCVVLVTLLLMVPVLQTFNFTSTVAATEDSYEQGTCGGGGSMVECGEIAEELSMELEITSKMILRAKTNFISPGALKNNLPVCDTAKRADPYSKSCISNPVNRQQRGCPKYYSCRG